MNIEPSKRPTIFELYGDSDFIRKNIDIITEYHNERVRLLIENKNKIVNEITEINTKNINNSYEKLSLLNWRLSYINKAIESNTKDIENLKEKYK